MARPKAFDEDTALEAAAQLFWSQGYDATSISELEKGMGMGRQSIYNAFGDKRQLFLKALDRYSSANKEQLRQSLLAPGAGMNAIRQYFRGMVEFATAVEPRRGCLVANSILEVGEADAGIASTCRRNQDAVLGAFEHALRNAVSDGDLPQTLDVGATAAMLMAQTYGLSVLAKSGISRAELEKSADALLDRLS